MQVQELNLGNREFRGLLLSSLKGAQTIGILDRWLSNEDGFDLAAIMRGDMNELEAMEEIDSTSRLALLS